MRAGFLLAVACLLVAGANALVGRPRTPVTMDPRPPTGKIVHEEGNHCSPAFTLGRLRNVDMCTKPPRAGQVLVYNGTAWRPATLATRPRHITCSRGQIKVCHVSASGHASEICVQPAQVDTHLRHPHDQLGECPDGGTPVVASPPPASSECPAKCGETCAPACDDACPSACDDVCPSACSRIEGPRGGQGPAGLACWDANENGVCDPDTEDIDGDGVCTPADCRGPPGKGERGDTGEPGPPGPSGIHGVNCWDDNRNGACDMPGEDKNADGRCDVLDCQGTCPAECSRAPGERGVACWDLNQNGACDLDKEDTNGDGECTVLDCQGTVGLPGPPGPHGLAGAACWDLNQDGACTLPDEDLNGDNRCDVNDCKGPASPKLCCYISVGGRHPDAPPGRRRVGLRSSIAADGPFLGEVKWTAWTAEGRCRSAPDGWAACDGSVLLAEEHPELSDLLGSSYGGDGKDTVGLPLG